MNDFGKGDREFIILGTLVSEYMNGRLMIYSSVSSIKNPSRIAGVRTLSFGTKKIDSKITSGLMMGKLTYDDVLNGSIDSPVIVGWLNKKFK